jgi:hypothetical protein
MRSHEPLVGILSLLVPGYVLAAPMGAAVQHVRYDPNTNIAWISVVNNSNKFITGFSVAVEVFYADGTKTGSERMEDFPQKAIAKQNELKTAWSGEGTIRPGDVFDLRYDVNGTPRNPIDHVNATVAVAAYSDGTADAQTRKLLSACCP